MPPAPQAPLTPPETDLRDFPYLPIDIARLFGSEFHARSDDASWRAGVTLWLKSFHQVPAASLPDDDIALTRLAELGRDFRTWGKIKGHALRGWLRCDDGRLYHPVVAEKALEAWVEKLGQRRLSASGNATRHSREFDRGAFDARIEAALRMLAALNPNSRTLARKLPKAPRASPAGTLTGLPAGEELHIRNLPSGVRAGGGISAPNCPDGSSDGAPTNLPAGSQGKGREEKERDSSSSDVGACEIDDDDLRRVLFDAAGGRIAATCRDARPIRKLLAEGVPLPAIVAAFRTHVAKLHAPLRTFAADFIAIEARANAVSPSVARGSNEAPARIFVAADASHWPLVEARYLREHGKRPLRSAHGPDGVKGLGWWFDAAWPECRPAPAEAAE